ncbi:hypothetical protein MPL3356_60488 [Mesorhizobium plurifarium]|uniref:Uncharacterized protein n=1 Tax=Mesorhizobium plurifarium TaxID=69974 RepID=A0A090EFE5_MESPL|nr:hypothetical protein MPL3356_60488 [Mesorhizobium plurifarium]
MTAAPYLLGRRGPGAYIAPGSGSGDGDGGFVDQPVVTTTSSGDTTIKGKVKAGSFGKFVVPLATVQAGRQYTFRYTPQFSQLAQQGKLAMVGFGFKTNNDFHIVGLRGDGSTGLDKYQVYGTPPNGWNAQTGHTTNDGGASASGTQAGPNYLRLTVSVDGTTYTLQSSADGSTWNTEFSGQSLSPFSDVSSVTTFGVALWFNNTDAGPFSITIDQFAEVDPLIELVTVVADTSASATIFTMSSVPIGAANANRTIYAVISFTQGSTSISSVTIGGVTAKRVINGTVTSAGPQGIYYAEVPTGTTATIVVTTAGSATNCNCAVYRSITAGVKPIHGLGGFGSGTTVTLSNLKIASGGFVLTQARAGNISGVTTSGSDALSQDDFRTVSTYRLYTGSILTTSVSTITITATAPTAVGIAADAGSFVPLSGSAYSPVLAGSFSDDTNLTTYTFNAVNIGTANANRQLVICFAWGSTVSRTVSSVTVGGVAATLVQQVGSTTGGTAIFRFPLSTGTTGNIVITMSGGCTHMYGAVYDTRCRYSFTPMDSKTVSSTALSVSTAAMQINDGGFFIQSGYIAAAVETISANYSGADTLNKDSQVTAESVDSVAFFSCLNTEFNQAVTGGISSGTSNLKRVAAASFL